MTAKYIYKAPLDEGLFLSLLEITATLALKNIKEFIILTGKACIFGGNC